MSCGRKLIRLTVLYFAMTFLSCEQENGYRELTDYPPENPQSDQLGRGLKFTLDIDDFPVLVRNEMRPSPGGDLAISDLFDTLICPFIEKIGWQCSIVQLDRFYHSATGFHATYRQVYDNVIVEGAELSFHLDKNGMYRFNGKLKKIEEVSNQARLDPGDIRSLVKALPGFSHIIIADVRKYLVVDPVESGRYIYKVRGWDKRLRQSFQLVLDAQSGDVLCRIGNLYELTGNGSIYRYDPFDGGPFTVPFLRLLDGYTLTGETVAVTNVDETGTYRTANSDGSGQFIYPKGDERLEMNMAYYWIDYSYHYNKDNLGLPGSDASFYAHTFVDRLGAMEIRNNAAFIGNNDILETGQTKPTFVFSIKDGLKNPAALSADVIIHEFNHWVTDSIAHLVDAVETTGIHEGLSDYFAASETGNPEIARYYESSKLGASLRDLDQKKLIDFPLSDELRDSHVLGEIYAQTLWDLHKRVLTGSSKNDLNARLLVERLVHQSRYLLNASTTDIREGFEALIDSDNSLYQGRFLAVLLKTFFDHGFQRLSGVEQRGENISILAKETSDDKSVTLSVDRSSWDAIPISYYWSIEEKPETSDSGFGDALDQDQRLIADVGGSYRVTVVVAEQTGRLAEGSIDLKLEQAVVQTFSEIDKADRTTDQKNKGPQVTTTGSCALVLFRPDLGLTGSAKSNPTSVFLLLWLIIAIRLFLRISDEPGQQLPLKSYSKARSRNPQT